MIAAVAKPRVDWQRIVEPYKQGHAPIALGHQYPATYWEDSEHWDFFDASMKGCSFYRAGWLVDFSTCNIGYHHIHHLCSRIPFYNLPRCYQENSVFHVKKIGFLESLNCASLALWDEDRKRLVPFK